MTPEKVREVIAAYRAAFEERGIDPFDYPHDEVLYATSCGLRHCRGMLDKMEVFITENRMDKVYRWLGFIQGVLWSQGFYTLKDLMNHNRKDSA